jgi:hypothetical protein
MPLSKKRIESPLLKGIVEDHDDHREAAPMRSTGGLVHEEGLPDDLIFWWVEYLCDVCNEHVHMYSIDTHERVYEVLVQAGIIQRADFGAAYGLTPDFPVSRRIESALLLDRTLAHDDLHDSLPIRSTGVMLAEAALPLDDTLSWRLEYWCEPCQTGVYRWDLYTNHLIRMVLIAHHILPGPF